MDCSLLDFGCHAQSALYNWWAALPGTMKATIVVGVLLMVFGSAWGVLQFVKKIGGGPAVAGAALLIVVGVLSLIPRKPEPKPEARKPVVLEDGTPVRKKPRTRTILDMLKR
jgi:vacuolar-type H+-ATPase subunit I/STV1